MADNTVKLRPRPSDLPRSYLTANLLLLIGVGAVAAMLLRPKHASPEVLQEQARLLRLAGLFTALPDTVEPWRGYDVNLDTQVADVLRYDWGIARHYVQDEDIIVLYVFRARDEKAFLLRAHAPPVCAASQGWQHITVNPETITVAGVPVSVQRMDAEKGETRRVTFYWEFPGWHLDGRGRRVADVFTVQADATVRTGPEATAEALRTFLAQIQPRVTGGSGRDQVVPVQQPVPDDVAGWLLAVDLAGRSVRPGSKLEVTSWWQDLQQGYVVVQLVRGDGTIWAEQRVPVPLADARRQTRVQAALTIPADIAPGHYSIRLSFSLSPDGKSRPFVNGDGATTMEALEPVAVKPVQLIRAADLPCQGSPPALFGDEIVLLCHQMPSVLPAGRPLALTLYWQATRKPGRDYVGFVRLRDATGQVVLEENGETMDGIYPTSAWDAGEIVRDVRTLPAEHLPVGSYRVEVGLFSYWTMRGQLVRAEGREFDDHRLVLGTVIVKPQQLPQVPDLATERRLDVTLGEEIVLLGYDVARMESRRRLRVTLYWQAKQRMSIDYTVFVHILDGDGRLVAQHDSWPLENRYPTSAWDAGEIVADPHVVDVADLPAGTYQVAAGMYDLRTMARMPLIMNGVPVPEDRVVLQALDFH
jgi:hypothetical protein